MALILNGSEAWNIFTRGIWKGLALKISTFLGPEMATSSLDFQGPPLPMPLIMMLHASKPLPTAPYKQQVH
jgi:hypothetical protein